MSKLAIIRNSRCCRIAQLSAHSAPLRYPLLDPDVMVVAHLQLAKENA